MKAYDVFKCRIPDNSIHFLLIYIHFPGCWLTQPTFLENINILQLLYSRHHYKTMSAFYLLFNKRPWSHKNSLWYKRPFTTPAARFRASRLTLPNDLSQGLLVGQWPRYFTPKSKDWKEEFWAFYTLVVVLFD